MKRTALAVLIEETEEHNGGRHGRWSDAQVIRQAKDAGQMVTRSDVSNYRREGMTKTLVPAKVRALAAGLKLPVYRVALAVLEDMGIHIPTEVSTPEAAIAHDHTLSVEARETLLLLLERERRAG